MSVYIKGMEMPTDGMNNIMILADGRVFQFSGYGNPKPLGTAVPVPPHGGLMDKDAFIDGCVALSSNDPHDIAGIEIIKFFMEEIVPTPTIIPADPERMEE